MTELMMCVLVATTAWLIQVVFKLTKRLNEAQEVIQYNSESCNKNFMILSKNQDGLTIVCNTNTKNIQLLANHIEIGDSFSNDRDLH